MERNKWKRGGHEIIGKQEEDERQGEQKGWEERKMEKIKEMKHEGGKMAQSKGQEVKGDGICERGVEEMNNGIGRREIKWAMGGRKGEGVTE